MNFRCLHFRWVILLWVVQGAFFLSSSALAQQPKKAVNRPHGQVLTDSIEIGSPFYYSFSFRHDPTSEVFFPDSTFDFSPFEFVDQEYFTTRTDSLGSLDSTIYTLISFEVAPTQLVHLPVYTSVARDCTALYAPADTVRVRTSLPTLARLDTLQIRPETQIGVLQRQIDYPLFGMAMGSIGVVIFLVYWFFGRAIRQNWRIFQLKRRHQEFVRSFSRLNRNARDRENTDQAEKAVVVWKKYLEAIENKPFATYTTREIVDNIPDKSLEEALQNIDKIIYGQAKSKQMEESLQTLRSVAQALYQQRRIEIVGIREAAVS